MSQLNYGLYEFDKYGYMQPPSPKLNGGLYTGEPFKGPYGNYKVTPDAVYMTNQNLKTAKGPTEGLFHYPGNNRPGNNSQNMTGVKQFSNNTNIQCLDDNIVNSTRDELSKINKVTPHDVNSTSNYSSNNF
jgi:hypothetical protein